MSRTRDIIEEISKVRERRQFGSAMAELPLRLFSIEQAFQVHDRSQSELTRYFPVALIACVESYFRMAIKDLIDAGDPFLKNAEKLASSLKLDFSLLRAVHGKTITVGELVAHGVTLSRLGHIEGALSSLLGVDFKQSLRTTTDRWAHEVRGEPSKPILSNPDEVFKGVARTFELRHIICHEIASAYEIDADEVTRCLESCVAFLRAADEFISETLHPGAPLTQTDMNIAACNSLGEMQEGLTEAVATIRKRLDAMELVAFNESQAKWEAYCDAWVSFVAGDRASSGSMWSMIRAGEAEAVVMRRLNEVKSWRRLGDAA